MHAVVPKKVPQTLLYGVRQARAALEQAPFDQALSLSRERVGAPNHSAFLHSTCPKNLPEALIGNVMGRIFEAVGESKMCEIVQEEFTASLSEKLKENELESLGMIDSSMLHCEQTSSILSCEQPSLSAPMSTSQTSQSFEPSEQKNNYEPSEQKNTNEIRDVTGQSDLRIYLEENIYQPAKDRLLTCMNSIHSFLKNCFGKLRTYLSGLFSDSTDRKKIDVTVSAVFFIAAYLCEQVLIKLTRSPRLINAYRQMVQGLSMSLPKFV